MSVVAKKLNDLTITPNASKMIERIIGNDGVFYRSEQRGTPDLTVLEKRELLGKLFTKNPRLFMSRYHGYLAVEDCDCFDQNDFEIQFYTNLVTKRCQNVVDKKHKNVTLRNQRFAEMQRLKRETDYFSDKKMREREPLLFDKMIGRFLPEDERAHLRPTVENDSLSGIFMQFEDSQIISDRRVAQYNEWNDMLKQNDDDDKITTPRPYVGCLVHHAGVRFCEETEIDGSSGDDERKDSKKEANDGCKIIPVPQLMTVQDSMVSESSEEDDYDKEQQRAEFESYMEQRFLRGDDTEFYDYTCGRHRMMREYERMQDRDLEEAYFESD